MSQSQDEWCCLKMERSLFEAITPDLAVSASPPPKKSAWGEQTQLQQQPWSFLPHCHVRLDPCESRRAPGQLQISLPHRYDWLPAVTNEADNRHLTHALCLHESQLHRLRKTLLHHVQVGFEYPQGRRFHRLSGQAVPGLCHTQCKVLSHTEIELPVHQFLLMPLVPLLGTMEQNLVNPLTTSLQTLTDKDEFLSQAISS